MSIQHVLIVDDSKTEQLFMSSLMQKITLTCSVADNADAALAQMERRKPDLILLDIVMPGKSGFQFARQISKTPEFADIPIILCSSKSQESDVIWGMRQGAKAYVTKPINPADLINKIRSLS